MTTITEKESVLVQKFRRRVMDVVPTSKFKDDYWLIRWIRARDLDLDKAESMLRKSMAWVRRNEMNSILSWVPAHNYFRFASLGSDPDGCPVFILPMGLWDMREMVEMGDLIPGVRAVIKILAVMEDSVQKATLNLNKPVNQTLLIFDCQQFSYRQLNNRTVCQGAIEFFRIFEANYPEILKYCFFINTPRIFSIFFALLKPFLSAHTFSKMEFFGPNKTKWTSALLAKIPPGMLPPYYGGSRRGTDEYCSQEDIWNDGPLPPNYFTTDMSKGRNSIYDGSDGGDLRRQNSDDNRKFSQVDIGQLDLKMAEIPPGSKLELEFPVTKVQLETGSIYLLKWRVKSEGYDIAFQVTFKDDYGSSTEDLIDNHRIESHLTQHDGSLVCDRPGTYVVVMDNTYSKRRKKLIRYSVLMEELENNN